MSTTDSGQRANIGWTCLVYHIDKGLCVVHKEATYRFILILAREDGVDEGGVHLEQRRI